jgi:predicted TIM-barrel fold metal-dependent hydrolase
MRSVIDAHVHIVPAYLLGKTDERFGVTVEACGIKRFADGSAYQFMPGDSLDSCYTVHALLRAMDELGIERAVILQSPCLSFNEDVIEAVQNHPDRFLGSMIVDPSDEGCLDEIDWACGRGLSIMKFEMSAGLGFTHPNMYPGLEFDSPLFHKIWAKAEMLGMTVTIDPSTIGSAGYQVERLARMMLKFPSLRWVVCHLGFPYRGMRNDPDRYKRWKQMTGLAEYANVWFDISALPALFNDERYPFPSAMDYLQEFIQANGADRPVWGSDVPGTLCFGTYAHLIDAFENCRLFTEEQKHRMLYRNALDAYF